MYHSWKASSRLPNMFMACCHWPHHLRHVERDGEQPLTD
jgi:hypothetical protein